MRRRVSSRAEQRDIYTAVALKLVSSRALLPSDVMQHEAFIETHTHDYCCCPPPTGDRMQTLPVPLES
jgi:hypothetical protein